MPIRVRLTAWYAGMLAVILLAMGTYVVFELRRDLRAAVDTELGVCTTVLTQALTDAENDPEAADPRLLASDGEDFLEAAQAALPQATSAVQLLDGQGRVLVTYGRAGSSAPVVGPETRRQAATGPQTLTAAVDAEDYRVRVEAVSFLDVPMTLVVGISLAETEQTVDRLLLLLVTAGPAAVLVTALAGMGLAGLAFRPVRRMTDDARRIGTDRLHDRVAEPAADDELRQLAVTLNAMLERIEQGALVQRRLVADASHELRSPLTVMRAELDVSLRGDELSPASREVLTSAREEVDRMRRTVDNLLTLAAVDEGGLPLLAVRCRMEETFAETSRSLAALATAREVTLVLEPGPEQVQADPQQLQLALVNLLENAIRFSPAGGRVRLTSWLRDGEVGLTVADQGPGVPAEHRERLFDRFYRVDSARGRGGSGLGLAICRAIVQAHGGRIWVEGAVGGGSAFSIALPAWRTLTPAVGQPVTT